MLRRLWGKRRRSCQPREVVCFRVLLTLIMDQHQPLWNQVVHIYLAGRAYCLKCHHCPRSVMPRHHNDHTSYRLYSTNWSETSLYNPSYSLVTLDNTLCFIHRGNKQHISYDACQMASYYLHSALLLTKSSALHIGNSLPFETFRIIFLVFSDKSIVSLAWTVIHFVQKYNIAILLFNIIYVHTRFRLQFLYFPLCPLIIIYLKINIPT